MAEVSCARCGQKREGLTRVPFPGEIGKRLLNEACQQCWGEWLKQQTMLINHYGLNVMDPQARDFLRRNMESFFFKSADADDVDTSKKGTINW
jgi:Fe-S cluster biosynthesis and repair protein YggX